MVTSALKVTLKQLSGSFLNMLRDLVKLNVGFVPYCSYAFICLDSLLLYGVAFGSVSYCGVGAFS